MNKNMTLLGVTSSFVINVVGSLYSRNFVEQSDGDALKVAGIAVIRHALVNFGLVALVGAVTGCCCVCVQSDYYDRNAHNDRPRLSFILGYMPLSAASVLASFILNWQWDGNSPRAREVNPLLPLGLIMLGYGCYRVYKSMRACHEKATTPAVATAADAATGAEAKVEAKPEPEPEPVYSV
ncbi:MAG: hypothetical protein P1U40_04975 [Coxiellaceae bacterium]|nr:hypothetical protein [Coxiellaceae bacterium]